MNDMTYLYAFGDHTWFMHRNATLYVSLKAAFEGPEDGSLLHVVNDGKLLAVFNSSVLLQKSESKLMRLKESGLPKMSARRLWLLLERYIRFIIHLGKSK